MDEYEFEETLRKELIKAIEEIEAWRKEQLAASETIEEEIVSESCWWIHTAGDWAWKREPWAPPDRPEKLRGLRQYGPARVVTEPPGGVLWLKCSRRFKKGSRSDHT